MLDRESPEAVWIDEMKNGWFGVVKRKKGGLMQRFIRFILSLLSVFFFALPGVLTAAYPERPIEIIVPFGVGGGSDTAARAIVPALEKVLKAKIVVTNMPGGGATKGMLHVAQQPPDGYTILAITTSHFIDAVKPKARANLLDDFVPVARYQLDTTGVLVGGKAPFKNLKDLIDYGKKNPRHLTFAGTSPGGWSEIQTISFAKLAGIQMTFVPYASGAEIKAAILGGHIHGAMEEVAETLPLIKAGQIRALAMISESRHPALPDVPTTVEQGINHTKGLTRGFAVRKGTPPDLAKLLADAVKKAMEDPSYKKFEEENFLHIRKGYLPLDQFRKVWEEEVTLYREILKEAGL